MKKNSQLTKIIIYQNLGFLGIIGLFYLDDLIKLPTLIFSDHPFIFLHRRTTLEMLMVLVVALVALVLGAAPRLGDMLARQPQIMDGLIDPRFFGAMPDQRELSAKDVRILSALLAATPAEIASRAGVSTPVPKEAVPDALAEFGERLARVERTLAEIKALLLDLRSAGS